VALQVPKINRAIAREHRELENIISSKKIDAVISDNRYGLWSDKVPCAIITHQLNIQSAFFKGMLKAKTIAHLQKFSIIWIPDYKQGDNLSGALSHPAPQGINAKYIGILSRFENAGERKEMKYDLLALLSGPEPQRTLLERKIIKQVKRTGNMKAFIVRGLPGGKPLPPDKNIETIAHLDKNSLFEKILCSKAILARPGYSTIMDLAAIGGKKVVFIPTPGQTEQEYLAMYLEAEGLAVSAAQNHFSLKDAWRKVFASQGFNNKLYKPIYKEAIDEWLKEIKN